MDDLRQQAIRRRLEQVLIAFFAACAFFVVGVYVAAPSIYTQALMLSPTPMVRYPLSATVFLVALLVFLTVVIVGVVCHWRWLFWLLLVAFGFSILQIPATILQLMGVVPVPFPAWYSLGRVGVALLEVGLAVWMLQIYRHHGVWAMGKKKQTSL
jgi:hypothetical protein